MSYQANVYKVMIASPSDVAAERSVIREVLGEWNVVNADTRKVVLLPVGWETHSTPAMGDRPQAIVNKQILKDCDLLVGVFWTRIGTATGEYASGTVEEIEEHIKTGKPAMLYFSDAPVHPDSVETTQYAALKDFKESCRSRGLLEGYSSVTEFKEKFYRQLQLKLNQDKYFAQQSSPIGDAVPLVTAIPDIPTLTKEAQVLLKAAAQDSHGNILRVRHMGGLLVQSNGQNFVEGNSARSAATWDGALKELETEGLIEAIGHKGEVFNVTRRGYEVAELLHP